MIDYTCVAATMEEFRMLGKHTTEEIEPDHAPRKCIN